MFFETYSKKCRCHRFSSTFSFLCSPVLQTNFPRFRAQLKKKGSGLSLAHTIPEIATWSSGRGSPQDLPIYIPVSKTFPGPFSFINCWIIRSREETGKKQQHRVLRKSRRKGEMILVLFLSPSTPYEYTALVTYSRFFFLMTQASSFHPFKKAVDEIFAR